MVDHLRWDVLRTITEWLVVFWGVLNFSKPRCPACEISPKTTNRPGWNVKHNRILGIIWYWPIPIQPDMWRQLWIYSVWVTFTVNNVPNLRGLQQHPDSFLVHQVAKLLCHDILFTVACNISIKNTRDETFAEFFRCIEAHIIIPVSFGLIDMMQGFCSLVVVPDQAAWRYSPVAGMLSGFYFYLPL